MNKVAQESRSIDIKSKIDTVNYARKLENIMRSNDVIITHVLAVSSFATGSSVGTLRCHYGINTAIIKLLGINHFYTI